MASHPGSAEIQKGKELTAAIARGGGGGLEKGCGFQGLPVLSRSRGRHRGLGGVLGPFGRVRSQTGRSNGRSVGSATFPPQDGRVGRARSPLGRGPTCIALRKIDRAGPSSAEATTMGRLPRHLEPGVDPADQAADQTVVSSGAPHEGGSLGRDDATAPPTGVQG